MFDDINYRICTDIYGDVLACGPTAIYENGLSSLPTFSPDVWLAGNPLDAPVHCQVCTIYPDINPNTTNYEDTYLYHSNNKFHVPNKERAVLEVIHFKDLFGEDTLVEGIYKYGRRFGFDKLYKLAPKYNVTKDELDYWIAEAEDWTVV